MVNSRADSPDHETSPSSYRPNTCLCTTWKFLLVIIVAKVNRHVAKYMSGAQKGIVSNTRGARHQLLVDRAVSQDCKTRQTNLCTAWIGYKKACDSMLHTWIVENLEMYNINRTLRDFIKNSNGAVENNSGGQLNAKCKSYHQVWYIPRRCPSPAAVLHRPESPLPDHYKPWLLILVSKWSKYESLTLHG